jgi:hypothetical protein
MSFAIGIPDTLSFNLNQYIREVQNVSFNQWEVQSVSLNQWNQNLKINGNYAKLNAGKNIKTIIEFINGGRSFDQSHL